MLALIAPWTIPALTGPSLACDLRTRQLLRVVVVPPDPRTLTDRGQVIREPLPGEVYVVRLTDQHGRPLDGGEEV